MPPLTLEQLVDIMPHCRQPAAYLPFLAAAMAEADITTPVRQAAFLAQLAHESGELRWWTEFATGEVYEGRLDLGNTQPGDGKRFKGRGPIQLTGRKNYTAAGEALSLELAEKPDRAADPDVGFRVAGWFWKTKGLNELADRGEFIRITRRVNGGLNGLKQREAYWARAKTALGVTP